MMPPEACLWRGKMVFQPAQGPSCPAAEFKPLEYMVHVRRAHQARAHDISLSLEQDYLDRNCLPVEESSLRRRSTLRSPALTANNVTTTMTDISQSFIPPPSVPGVGWRPSDVWEPNPQSTNAVGSQWKLLQHDRNRLAPRAWMPKSTKEGNTQCRDSVFTTTGIPTNSPQTSRRGS